MKVNISQKELATALTHVIKVIAARPTIPILSGIMISAQKDGLFLYGSDLESSIKIHLPALVETEGKMVVPGKIFCDIIRALPDSSVLLEQIGETVSIKAQQAHFTVSSLHADDFAAFPKIEGIQSFSLPVADIKDMVDKTSKSVSRDETRIILTAILLTLKGDNIKMVATDSYRLSLSEKSIESDNTQDFEALIPGKSFDDAIKMAQKTSILKFTFSSNQISFQFDNIHFITRRIEGNYPNYPQLIPSEYTTKATLVREEIIEAVKRASLMALGNSALVFTVSTADQAVTVSAASQDYGKAEENISSKVEGEDNKIAVNPAYLLDGLSVMHSEFVSLEIVDPLKPGILRSIDEQFMYLFMPVRT